MADTLSRTWSLFERKLGKPLYCAVPDGSPLPNFIKGGSWSLSRKVSDARTFPRGFNEDLAQLNARLAGFYVFHGLAH